MRSPETEAIRASGAHDAATAVLLIELAAALYWHAARRRSIAGFVPAGCLE